MFTGIVTAMGRVASVEEDGGRRFIIAVPPGKTHAPETPGTAGAPDAAPHPWTHLDVGESVACSGVCLTVTGWGTAPDHALPSHALPNHALPSHALPSHAGLNHTWFSASASCETLSCTTAGDWNADHVVNLERALRAGELMGGHMVSGHVDGLAVLERMCDDGASRRLFFRAPADLARFIAPKGSVTLDGVSLTVNGADGSLLDVNLIPHTRAVTTLGRLAVGGRVNLEVDMVARHLARLLDARPAPGAQPP